MAPVKAYFLEATEQERHWLRRFVFSDQSKCLGKDGYHNAMFLLGDADIVWTTTHGSTQRFIADRSHSQPPESDPRWPVKCDSCDYRFTDKDQYQLFGHQLYKRQDTGEIMTIEDAPPGALWYGIWWKPTAPDGHVLMAKCPGGHDWNIDGCASNCDKPDDKEHRCWVRHGEPPLITVDKNGNTCKAGAGSILTPSWHGYLRNGEFVEC